MQRFSSVNMEGLAYVDITSGLPGSGIQFIGDLNLVQKQPLAHKGRDDRYKKPIFDGDTIFAEDFDFTKILMDYNYRNGKLK